MKRRLILLHGTQLGAAAAFVNLKLLGRGQHRLFKQKLAGRLSAAHANRQLRRANAAFNKFGKGVLYHSVL